MRRVSRVLTIIGGIILLAIPAWANYCPFPEKADEFHLAPLVVFLDFAFDLFCILLSLRLLKRIGTHSLGRLLGVGVLVTIVGFLADYSAPKLMRAVAPHAFPMAWVLLAVVLILAANWIIGLVLLRLSVGGSAILGGIIGLLTMPIAGPVNEWLREWLYTGYSSNGHAYGAIVFWRMAVGLGLADVILLCLLRPVSPLRRWQISVIGLAFVTACALVTLSPIRAELDIAQKVFLCGMFQRGNVVAAIDAYRKDRGEYPDKLEDLLPKYLRHPEYLHCPLDPDRTRKVSYVYRKPSPAQQRSGDFWLFRCDHHPGPPMYVWKDGDPIVGERKRKSRGWFIPKTEWFPSHLTD